MGCLTSLRREDAFDELAAMEVGSDGRHVYFRVLLLLFLLHQTHGCQDSPVGIADSSIIPDDRFTPSSYYAGNAADTRYVPWNARLNGATGRGWGPRTESDPTDYLQIDLGQVFVICAVATQKCNGCSERTTEYKISTSVNNVTWTTLQSGNADKLFPGNAADSNTVVKNNLDYPVLLRYIRFIPTNYEKYKVLRVEAYGVHRECRSPPVGIGSGKIQDSNMTSSSAYNSTTSPSKARLNYRAGSSWCAATSDSSPYLQINLGSPYIICGTATQGDHMTDQWVQSYHMLTSSDGSTFNNYMEDSQTRSFTGNYDSSTAVKDILYDGTVSQYIRVAPTSHYGSTNCMRTELYGIKLDGECTSLPFGLSYPSIIPDHRFSASSSYGGNNGNIPSNARLKAHRKAWTPETKSVSDWLQIDLGSVVFVCAVATQGAGALSDWEYATLYKLRMSLDNVNWFYYQEENIDKTFPGNTNSDGIVTNSLRHPMKAKFVRFYPMAFYGWPTMRVEVYGISSACSSPVGLEVPGVIRDSQMTSSPYYNDTHTASHGRLYGSSSWCSSTSSNTEYIQINLGQVMTVTGIATQGDHTMDKWVTTFTISYSMDGNLWNNTYKDRVNSDKIFQGNSDKENITVQWLSLPVTARHVRVTPQTWNTAICMRIELYGCDYETKPVISGLTNQNLPAASNSYVDLVCIVQEPLIQYIKWYTGNTDITSQSTGLVRAGANGVKQSTLRVNYTSADDALSYYDCNGTVCSKAFVCKAMYEDTETNADGIKSAGVTVKLDYPSIPTTLTVHDKKSTSVNVTWTQPALKASQSRVTKYVLQYQTQTIDVLAPATSHVITGLAIYTDYSVKIKAISRVGPGLWSVTKSFRTDSAVPVATPGSVTATALTSRSIRVTWQAPTSGIHGELEGYKVNLSLSLSGKPSMSKDVSDGGTTSLTITGLEEWTVYHITVQCYNDKGNGPASAIISVRTSEDAPSQPLQSFNVTVLSSTSVRVSWRLPPISDRNGIIRGFEIHYKKTSSNKNDIIKNITDKDTRSYDLDGLDKYKEYTFKVLAYTIKKGPISNNIVIKTLEDAPSAPTGLQVSLIPPVGPKGPQVKLTWKEPVNPNGVIRYYNASYSKNGGTVTEKNVTSELTWTISVLGGQSYRFEVKAVTIKEGDSVSKTTTVKIYKPTTAPKTVRFVEHNKTTYELTWEPVEPSNGPVLTYGVFIRKQSNKNETRLRRDVGGSHNMLNVSCCSLTLHKLPPCSQYNITVRAYTAAGPGIFSEPMLLLTSEPPPPSNLVIKDVGSRQVTLRWTKPASLSKAVKKYIIRFNGTNMYDKSFKIPSNTKTSEKEAITIFGLHPYTSYLFEVFAETECGEGKKGKQTHIDTKIDAPPAPEVNFLSNINASTSSIKLWEASSKNGPISAYQLIVIEEVDTPLFDEGRLTKYDDAKEQKLHYYIAAEIPVNLQEPFQKSFTLGDMQEYNGYKNMKLEEGKKYNVTQRAFTQNEKKEDLAGPLALIAVGEVPATKVQAGQVGTGVGAGAIAGIAVVIVLIIAAVLCVVIFVWKRRNSRERESKRESPDDLDNALDLNDIQNEENKKASSSPDSRTNLVDGSQQGPSRKQAAGSTNGALRDEDLDLYSNADALRHQPIPINKFPQYVSEKNSGDNSFKEEFKTLSNGQQYPWDNARTPTNKPKNRYANIISYDHSRVIIQESEDGSDYINASYIHGFDGTPRTYIASQGPIPTTAGDFWQMVWQEKIKTVVMLTNLIEAGRVKCHQYWPDKKETYGPITVTLHRSDVLADYVVRVFILAKSGKEGKIQVHHYQYTSWPDKGVPQHATSVLGFRRKVRAHYASVGEGEKGPLLVHCSAGVGRTGAFVAVDAMLERTRKDKTIDIFNFVQLMRNNRITMVQTEEQYAFVHYAVLEALTCGNTEVPVMNLNIVMSKLSKPRSKDQMIGYEVEFRRLNHISPALLTEESSDVGQKEENMSRNRYPDVIPLDCARVFLSNEKQNYINASFANAYRERNAFIMTQAPLKNTMYDFWHMVHQYKIGSVVMLNVLHEEDETFPPYLPSEGSQSYHGIKVEVTATENNGPLVIKKCKMIHPMEPQTPHNFIHVQHTKWPNQSIPDSRQSVLDLVTIVQRSQQQCGNTPIAVQCSDGVGRSGTFAAVYSLLERVKAEQVMDVFQAIKVLRLGRPNAVKTVEQYKFCYMMVQTYLDSFNDYANFSEV